MRAINTCECFIGGLPVVPRIEYCPLHAAAEELLRIAVMAEAIAMMELEDGDTPNYGPRDLLDTVRAAIAKADPEGKWRAKENR